MVSNLSFSGVQVQENYKRIPNPQEVDQPTMPKLAQGGAAGASDTVVKDKNKFTVKGVSIGTGKPGFWGRLLSAASVAAQPTINTVVNQNFKDVTNKGTWSEPASAYAAQYPYNQVTETEAGHVLEFDDTPGAERIHIFHRAGSFIEWHPDGTVVYKSLKNGYILTASDQFVKVGGNCHIAVDGTCSVFAKGDINVQSDSDVSVQAKGDFNVYAKNINLRAKQTFKGDGTKIDLRYIKLPGSIFPYFIGFSPSGQFGPRVDLAAIAADFPSFDATAAADYGGDTDNIRIPPGFAAASEEFERPPENPLANPGVYAIKTPEAVSYRAKFFDTPEEVGNFEHYTAHTGLQDTLGDTTGDAKALAGKLTTLETGLVAPETKPTVDLLDFNEYKGTFEYSNTAILANTTFAIEDLVDSSIHENEMILDMSTPIVVLPPVEKPTAPTVQEDNPYGY
jgi:hypothetical protein